MSRLRAFSFLVALGVVFSLTGCMRDMQDQPKYKNLRGSDLFADGMSARPQVEGTLAQGHLRQDEHFFTGKINGEFVSTFPMKIDKPLLQRGRERYDIFCAVCHGKSGEGDGMVVKRGFPTPPSYHIQRLRDAQPGYFYDVITNGFGRMFGYASEIEPADRWAIAAYIKALQRSQNTKLSELTPEEREALNKPAASAAEAHAPAHH